MTDNYYLKIGGTEILRTELIADLSSTDGETKKKAEGVLSEKLKETRVRVGTTAHVAEQWGRRWITCDTSRVALALARTRLMAAKYPYYLLADSPEGIKKKTELTGKMPPDYKTAADIKKGFVYRRVPHVTLKSIANKPESGKIAIKVINHYGDEVLKVFEI